MSLDRRPRIRFEKHVGAASAPLAAGYCPRKPERTLLYPTWNFAADAQDTIMLSGPPQSTSSTAPAHGAQQPAAQQPNPGASWVKPTGQKQVRSSNPLLGGKRR